MSPPGKKAPAHAGGIRRWLSTVVVSVVALVLTLVVISLSIDSSLTGASLHEYLFVKANDSLKLTDGNMNDTAIGVPLQKEVLQGVKEVSVEHNDNVQSGTMNSSETGEIDTKVPDPVAADDTTSVPDEGNLPVSSDSSDNLQKANEGSCDLYHGQWVFYSSGPLYTNNSFPIITQMQNCQGNGRPDKEYENYRWKPEQCILPRFDGKKFLELMRCKTIAFVGDSVARNQMESLTPSFAFCGRCRYYS